MSDVTTVQAEKSTRKRLKVWKTRHEMTYDEAINHLLDAYEAGDGGEFDAAE